MKNKLLTTRRLILVFMVCLFISGLTAIPVEPQLELLLRYIAPGSILYLWIEKVLLAYRETSKLYPFLLYGYDWLAFAH
ncbi:MAG TPA: hypothetical protein VEX63_12445, partial [Flavisolibacter sp.]|nr:hypothetical protein [Flavisolibacter sp.]